MATTPRVPDAGSGGAGMWASGWIRLVGVLRLAGAWCRDHGWWGWVVLVLGLSACVPPGHTTARDGVIDLSGEQFSRGRVPLDGEWRGIRGAHVPADAPMVDASLWTVPGSWPMTRRGIACSGSRPTAW